MSGFSSASFRVCCVEECKVRLPKTSVDPHTVCTRCRGYVCLINDRCKECESLPDSSWKTYDSYVRKLERDRIRRSSSRSVSASRSQGSDFSPANPPVDFAIPNPVVLPSGPEVVSAEGNTLSMIMDSIRNLESKVLALQSGVVKCSDGISAPSVMEGASDRPYNASRPGPLSDSQDSGSVQVESRRRVTGAPHRSGVPSAGPDDASQAAKDRARARILKDCFLSSEASSPRKGWSSRKDSRPLKRSFREEDASRPFSRDAFRSSPESFDAFLPQKRTRTSSEDDSVERPSRSRERAVAFPVRRKKASPRPSSSHRISPSPEKETSPTKKILLGMQRQLASFIAEREAEPRRRRKDSRLPIKRSKQSPSPSPRSSPSSASSPSRFRLAPQRVSRGFDERHPRHSLDRKAHRRDRRASRHDAPLAPLHDALHAARHDAPQAARNDASHAAATRQDAPFADLRDASEAAVKDAWPCSASTSSKRRSLLRVGPQDLRPPRIFKDSPVAPVEEGELLSSSEPADEEQPSTSSSTSDYQVLARLLRDLFGDKFQPSAPRSPPSQLASLKTRRTPGFVKMSMSLSTKRAFKKVHDWMDSRKAQGKTSFALPPSRLSGKAGIWYETGEDVGLRVPSSSQGDFASLVDAPRRSLLSSAKVSWTLSELDHHLKGLFRTMEVFNFLDWCLGVLDLQSRSPDSISLEELSSVLACMDKAVRDGSDELAARFCTGLLKKRALYCNFTAKSVSPSQRAELLFAPLSSHLFPQSMVKDLAVSLQEKATQDLLAQLSRRPAVLSATPLGQASKKQKPFHGGASSRSSPRGRGLPRGRAPSKVRGKK
ncbi:serine/arginine repetitive matrix protein 1-like isoform X1 [Macrobrachium nipponense]|uniref:serine/arginine repetitive matrix protein 1-like isoform X1 n=1 Tax=Macrobrachium nipponense TaxID=159736 RepID=UPI0030C822EC